MKKCLLFFAALLWQLTSFGQAGHVVISEVYGGGGNSGALYKNDFVELYNPTDADIVMTNWSLQYTSAAGTTWSSSNRFVFSGTIKAKGYFLIKGDSGNNAGTVDLPTPDGTSNLALSATNGKVALCSDNVLLSGANPSAAANVVDFVGFGSANGYETAATPALSNTTSAERKATSGSTATTLAYGGSEAADGNGVDTNNNLVDFVIQSGVNPQSSTSPNKPSPQPALTVSPTTLAFGNQGVGSTSTERTYTFAFSYLGSADLTLTVTGPYTISKATGPRSFATSQVYTAAERTSSPITVYAVFTPMAAGSQNGTIVHSGAGLTSSVTLNLTGTSIDPNVITKIHTIQGISTTATAGTFNIEGIVTAVFPNWDPAGYYIQEEDSDADADPLTSEGIFVAQTNPLVAEGDKVRITGATQENSSSPSYGQAVITPSATTLLSSGNPMPTAVSVTLPVSATTDLEKYEGMRVVFPQELTVSDNSSLGQYGQVSLSQGGLVYQPTQIIDPNDTDPNGTTSAGTSNVAAINAAIVANASRTVILDDGFAAGLTYSVSTPKPPYTDANGSLRVGTTISNLVGVLGYGFSAYRIQPIASQVPVFNNVRPSVPTDVGSAANVTVASFNVLNYFNGDGLGGGFPTTRGATTLVDFQRQRTKIIKAISELNADIVGLMEIENDGVGTQSALQDLVNGLNAAPYNSGYALVDDSSVPNGDLIRCAMIYKPARVTPVGGAISTSDAVFSRPPFAQNFKKTVAEGGARTMADPEFVVIVNHFKSKGSCPSGGSDPNRDMGDGQSCHNLKRKEQAGALITFVNSTVATAAGHNRVITIGDFNAYYEEDPLDILRAGNYTVLGSSDKYSYLFGGQVGSLDHAIVNGPMAPFVTGMVKWNANGTEPDYLSYGSGARWSNLYQPDAYRASDHDAILVGLNMSSSVLPVNLVSFQAEKGEDGSVNLSWRTAGEANSDRFEVQRSMDGRTFDTIGHINASGNTVQQNTYSFTDWKPLSGVSYYKLKMLDLDGMSEFSKAIGVQVESGAVSWGPNPAKEYLKIRFTPGGTVKLKLTSISGKAIVTKQFSNATGWAELPVSSLSSGLYLLSVDNGAGVEVHKVVVP